MMKKLIIAGVVVLFVTGSIFGVKVAADTIFTQNLPVSVSVASPTPPLRFYSDQWLNNQVTTISFDKVARGGHTTVMFYAYNASNGKVTLQQANNNQLDQRIGSILVRFNDNQLTAVLAPKDYCPVTVTLLASLTADPTISVSGVQCFSIISTDGSWAPTPTPTPSPSPSPTPTPTPTVAAVSFSTDVLPILGGMCVSCHGQAMSFAGVKLDGYAVVMQTVTANNSAASMLYRSLNGSNGLTKMPPSGSLSQAQITTIGNWIDQGALNN